MEAPAKVVKIGERVHALREERLWTQAELSEKAGITQKQISLIEKDHVDPRFATIRKLADAFGVDPSVLVKS